MTSTRKFTGSYTAEELLHWANEEQYPAMKERLADRSASDCFEQWLDMILETTKDVELVYVVFERMLVKLDIKMTDSMIDKYEKYYNCKGFYEYFRKV